MLDLFFRKYAWAANLLLLFLAAWLAAKTVNTLVGAVIRPRPSADLSLPAGAGPRVATVAHLDDERLYKLIGVEPPAPETVEAAPVRQRPQNCEDPRAAPVKSELRLTLVAGVLAEPRRYSLATLTDLGSRQTVVAGIGDPVQGATLIGLERARDERDVTGNGFRMVAILCNEGTKEYVDEGTGAGEALASAGTSLGISPIPPPTRPPGGTGMEGIRSVGANKYEIDRTVLDSNINNLSALATQARIIPSFKNNVANGFKLISVQPGSLYSAIGIENGDVIQRINGYELNSPEKALELYQKLREAGRVSIELERGGQVVKKEYTITGP